VLNANFPKWRRASAVNVLFKLPVVP
jgi:hypothetical protein